MTDSFEELIRSLKLARYPSTQCLEAVGSLESICKSIIQAMIEVLSNETSNEKVRKSVISSLKSIYNESTVSSLIVDLKTGDNDMKLRAASSLGKLGNPMAASFLIEILNNYLYSEPLRFIAACSLGHIGDSTALWVLTKTLDDGHHTIRSAAQNAIAEIERKA
jgi:HEAT repeat protein